MRYERWVEDASEVDRRRARSRFDCRDRCPLADGSAILPVLRSDGLLQIISEISDIHAPRTFTALAPNGWVFFVGILITMMFGDGAFGILNAFGAEQFSTRVRATGLGLGYGIGATAKIVGPALMGMLIGGSMIKQNVTLQAVPMAFFLFAGLLVVGGIVYLSARETKAVSLDDI